MQHRTEEIAIRSAALANDQRWRSWLAWAGVGYLIIAAAGKLAYALPRLLWDIGPIPAFDLKYRYEEVARWFSGLPVYEGMDRLVYPPASYLVMWPFMGWLSLPSARAVWAVTLLAAAAVMAVIAYRLAEGHPRNQRLLLALLVYAAYPTQLSVIVGQLGVHAVALSAAAAFVLFTARPRWRTDLAASLLLAASLVKPTLALPLAVGTLVPAGRWRPAILSCSLYGIMTVCAAAAQPQGLVDLARGWITSMSSPELMGEGLGKGLHGLHRWMDAAGMESWSLLASLVLLGAFALWVWRHRDVDPWILLGVAAIVARLWTYHRDYDEVVLLLAMIPLLRASRVSGGATPTLASVLFLTSWAVMLTPTWAMFERPPLLMNIIRLLQLTNWLVVLAFLLWMTATRRDTLARRPAMPDRPHVFQLKDA